MAELFPSAGTITSDAHCSRWIENHSCCIERGGTPGQFAVSAGAESASLNVVDRVISRVRPLAAASGSSGAPVGRAATATLTEYDRIREDIKPSSGGNRRVPQTPAGSRCPWSRTRDLAQDVDAKRPLDLP